MRIQRLQDAFADFPDTDGFWLHGNLPETETRIQAALTSDLSTKCNSKNLLLLIQLARVQALQGHFTPANSTLDQALQMLNGCETGHPTVCEIRWLLEHGRVLSLSKSPSKANEAFAKAWTLASESGEGFLAIDAALMLSSIRPPKFQYEWLQKALQLAEAAADGTPAKLWLTQLFYLDGWHSFDLRQYEKALESFDKALAQSTLTKDETKNRAIQWSKGRALRALGKIPEAIAIQETLLSTMTQTGVIDGHVYLEIAECQQLLNKHDEAKRNFEWAHTALSSNGWYSDNHSDELARMKYLFKKR